MEKPWAASVEKPWAASVEYHWMVLWRASARALLDGTGARHLGPWENTSY